MVHCLDRLRFTAADTLVRLANQAPKKRASNIFLILNLTCIVTVRAFIPRSTVLSICLDSSSFPLVTLFFAFMFS